MRVTMRWLVAASIAVALCVLARAESGNTTKPLPAPKRETVYWIVVEVKSLTGDVSYEAIPYKDLKDRLERPHDEYLKALGNWNKAKADAVKNGKKFDTPKPVEGYVKRVGNTTTYKSQEDAKAAIQKILDAIEARKKAAREKQRGAVPAPE